MRVRWLWSEKPHVRAITLMLSSVASNRSMARPMRWRTSHRWGGAPMLTLNAFVK
jgi:hypothetical protein